MASKDDGEKANCTITWIIENISYCWQEKGEIIASPLFLADTIEDTKWTLWLFPRGKTNGNYISYFLKREEDGNEVETIQIDYELSFLGAHGSVRNPIKLNDTFKKNAVWGYNEFAKREDVFATMRSEYLPEDSLTARCRIWKSNEKVMETRQLFARTIIKVERQSFAWGIENFTSLEPDQMSTVIIKSASGVVLLTCDLNLTRELCLQELLNIDIVPSDKRMKSLKFQTFLVSSDGSKTDCGKKEFIFGDLRKRDFTLLHSKKQLFEYKSYYLPNDVLTLNCECAFSTGVTYSEVFEIIDFGNNPPRTKNVVATNLNEHAEGSLSNALLNGFKFLYKNELLCDVKLCTKTETFPAHSVLLSAVSPVFRAMFTTDMKEKAKESVDIPDVDADTLRQMLQYVYTDTLEITDWENASLLYAVADKYEIMSMKKLCSSYLKNYLCQTNACETLVLSDMHKDEDLKKAVQDYILSLGVVIFESDEWIQLMEANLKLAAETMRKNWIKH